MANLFHDATDLVIHGCLKADYRCGCFELYSMDGTVVSWSCKKFQGCAYKQFKPEALAAAQKLMAEGVLYMKKVS